jgi:DNA-binding transcriptional ArsR family regulator
MANYSPGLDTIFHALSDPTRRAVVQHLVNAPASVKELASSFDMALPSFMKHLAVLEDCGLITSVKVGRVRTCRIQPERLSAAEGWLSAQRKLWEDQTDRLAEYVENQFPKEGSL